MKLTILLTLILLITASIQAQNTNIIFFTEQGERFSVVLNVGGTGTQTTTTTTTTTVSSGERIHHYDDQYGYERADQAPAQGHGERPRYQLPGYNGIYGCPYPMSYADFEQAKQSIRSKSFDESKLTIAKQIINTNCLLSSQVKEIMLLFSFEDTRLDLAKFAYGHTLDIGNYYKLNDAFTFESSIEELNRYISAYRR
jgi:hypothetical protein